MISGLVLVGILGIVTYLLLRICESAVTTIRTAITDVRSIMQKKDERIAAMDADYKALVESYLRETGKVYMRPAMTVGEKLKPAEPNPWKCQPPPPWAPRVGTPKAGK